jgi:hypothetical protein
MLRFKRQLCESLRIDKTGKRFNAACIHGRRREPVQAASALGWGQCDASMRRVSPPRNKHANLERADLRPPLKTLRMLRGAHGAPIESGTYCTVIVSFMFG